MNDRKSTLLAVLPVVLILTCTSAAFAAGPPCQPCAGIRVEQPSGVAAALSAEPRVQGDERLYVQWAVDLDGSADPSGFGAVLELGGTPWMTTRFRVAMPIAENLEVLEAELRDLARLARGSSERAHFQILWEPAAGEATAKDFSFLLKRAAVAVTGARADARVLIGPFVPDVDWLRALYAEEVAAYVDGLALSPAPRADIKAVVAAFRELDPGKGVVLDALPWPAAAAATLSHTADWNRAGISVVFFERPRPTAADLAPLKLLAREFVGDLSFDPGTVPSSALGAWTYVRGEDLSLRVIAEAEPGEQLDLFFDDAFLKSPKVLDPSTLEESTPFGQRRTQSGLFIPVEEPGAAVVLKLDRMTAAEIEGIEGLDEEVNVEDERQMPVEEIIRRLQAFEDGQNRRLRHYQAQNTLDMRFNITGGNPLGTLEVTFRGDFFYRQNEGFDWAWDELYLNGVKWKRNKIPEIPLIQPEKSAVLPIEITFSKDYRYRLRGTATVEGRDCWVVDFAPAVNEEGRVLSQGTLWVDRELYVRVKTRAVQLGLEGEVISNEETIFFEPVDENGESTAWTRDAYYLPMRSVGQQLLSLLNATTQVERSTRLENVRINGESFDADLEAKYASQARMVRDTEEGLRYLEIDEETGERVVQEEPDMTQKFLIAGAFYDAGLDFPVPLAGINILSRDWRGKGLQLNGFFAGPLIIGTLADPSFFGSKWDVGVNVFGLAVSGEEELFRDGVAQPTEDVETGASGRINVSIGRPLGEFWKIDFDFGVEWDSFDTADDTSEDFILPQDTLTTRFQTQLRYNRAGYRAIVEASINQRADWEFWGLPGNAEFDLEQEDYVRWRIGAGKTWWLPKFTKFGIDLDHLNGSDLDRFSKYDFDFFSESRVAGYQDGIVTAEEATGIHLLYGFDLAEVFRVQLQGDAVWASDEATGLEDELLAGISLNGTVMGPWGTLVNFDVGVPVEGPADDLVVFLAVLKLFQ